MNPFSKGKQPQEIVDNMATVTALYDSKSEVFSLPHFHRNRGMAERSIMEGLRDPQATMTKYPADFTFFEIGLYDEQKGEMHMHPNKINLGTALEFLQRLNKIEQQIKSTEVVQ